MNEIEFEKKYHERYVRWQDKTREQLSFFNNLLFTLSIGFLSFAYKNLQISNIKFCICSPNCKTTLLVISIISIALSIFVGLLCVINRLYDFRTTAHINQVRYWFEKSTNNSNKGKLDGKTPEKFSCCDRNFLTFKVLTEKYPRLRIEDCDDFHSMSPGNKKTFNDDFRELRNIAHNLGIGTWIRVKWQIALFFIGIISFVFSHFSI